MKIIYRRFTQAKDTCNERMGPCLDPRLLAARVELAHVAAAEIASPSYEATAKLAAAHKRLRELETELGII